jgi:uncharacterized protein YlbG (UPF0298 family)
MEIPKVVPAQLALRQKKARNAVNVALTYERTYKKLQRMGALHNVAFEYQKMSICAWDEVEEMYAELHRFKECMRMLEPECWSELECRIYDV